jgi:hypothetical protein
MKSLSKDELKTLMSKQKGPCISLFMPAYRAGAEIQQNQIRFRNLLREAEEKLIANGHRAPEAKALLEPAQGLSGNIPFWRQQSGGLAIFISSDAELDDAKENISKYFRQIDRGLHDLLRDERVPLVLAGVDYLFPIYREVNTYPYLMEDGIPGNPKGISTEQLHKLALGLVRPYFQKAENDAIAQYRQSSGTGHRQWGIFDAESKDAQLHQKMEPGSEDLLDFSAIQTLLNGGTVYSLAQDKMPDDKPIAAVFRY